MRRGARVNRQSDGQGDGFVYRFAVLRCRIDLAMTEEGASLVSNAKIRVPCAPLTHNATLDAKRRIGAKRVPAKPFAHACFKATFIEAPFRSVAANPGQFETR